MKIAFGTVVYESALKYKKEFCVSLLNQRYKNFDVLVICDNLDNLQISEMFPKDKRFIFYNYTNYTPSDLRIKLIEIAYEAGYDLLLIGDFDDVFSSNRVKKYNEQYNENITFFYNDLRYLSNKHLFFKQIPDMVEKITQIEEQNFVGLSNSGVNLKKIDIKGLKNLYHKNIKIFDWFFFSFLLLNGGTGKKIKDCSTYYRIHENNIAGENIITKDSIVNEIKIKIDHYQELCELGYSFQTLLNEYSSLLIRIKEEDFQKILNKNSCFWWSQIVLNNKVEVKNEI